MNGQEKDDEVFKGAMGAEYWEYDSRIGRRWELDPVIYPWQSRYSTFNNNPIQFADPKGLEGTDWYKGKDGAVVWKAGDAKTIEIGGETYNNIGESYTQNDIVDGSIATTQWYQDKIVGFETREIDYSAVERGSFSNRVSNFLSNLDGALPKGRTYGEGEDWVKSFKMGVNVGVTMGGYSNKIQFGVYSTSENNAGGFISVEQSAAIKTDPKNGMLATTSGVDATVSGFISVSNQNEFAGNEKSTTAITPYTSGEIQASINGVGPFVNAEMNPSSPNKPIINTGIQFGIGVKNSASGDAGIKTSTLIKSNTYKLD